MNIDNVTVDQAVSAIVSSRQSGESLSARGYQGEQPPEQVSTFLNFVRQSSSANPDKVLTILAEYGLGEWADWYHDRGASRAPSAARSGAMFASGVLDGSAERCTVFLFHDSYAVDADLHVTELTAADSFEPASHGEAVSLLSSWAQAAGIQDVCIGMTGESLIDVLAGYSASSDRAPASQPAPLGIAEIVDGLNLPPNLAALVKIFGTKLDGDDLAALNVALGRSQSAPSQPPRLARGALGLPPFCVVTPTVSYGGFSAGSPVLVIGSKPGADSYFVFDGSRVVESPSQATRSHIRAASVDEAKSFLRRAFEAAGDSFRS